MVDQDPPTGQPSPGLLESLWRFKGTSLAVLFVVALLAGLYGLATRDEPAATIRLTLGDPRGNNVFRRGNSTPIDLSRYTGQRAAFTTSDTVLQDAADALGGTPSAGALRGRVTASAASSTDIISVTARADTPAQATRLADAVVQAYLRQSQRETDAAAQRVLDALDGERQRLLQSLSVPVTTVPAPAQAAITQKTADTLVLVEIQITEVKVNAALFGNGVSSIDPVEATPAGDIRGIARLAVLGTLFGFLLALALAWVRADRRPTADDASVPAAILDAPVLAEVPEVRRTDEVRRLTNPLAGALDPYAFAAATMQARGVSGVVLLVGGRRSEGRTASALSLAAASAAQGLNVLLVDADVRTAGLSRFLEVAPDTPGVIDVLDGRSTLLDAAMRLGSDGDDGFDILSIGRETEGDLPPFRPLQVADFLDAARKLYDLVLIDAAPLLDAPETAAVASQADHLLAVVARETPVRDLEGLRQRLNLFRADLVGTVFTRAARTSDA